MSEEGEGPVLPDDLRGDSALSSHIAEDGTVDWVGIAKSAVHAQRMVGADRITLPKEDAPAEEWDTLFTKLGRPKEAAEYELTLPEGVVLDVGPDDPIMGGFGEAAHAAGLSASQARALYQWYAKTAHDLLEADAGTKTAALDAGKEELQKEFGDALPKHLELAKNAMAHFGGEALTAVLEGSGLGNDPAMVRAFVKVGKAMSEDTLSGKLEPGRFGITPELAQRRIAELRTDPAWRNALDPKHGAVMAEIHEMGEIIAKSM